MSDNSEQDDTEAPPSAGLRISGGRYVHVASRIFGVPLMIDPRKLEVILQAIGPRMQIEVEPAHAAWPAEKQGFSGPWAKFDRGSYTTVHEGVGILDVSGSLVHKGRWLGSYSGVTSYDGLSEQFAALMKRDDVRAIMLNIHSPGGEVAGAFDFADEIVVARGQGKPIIALAADMACSAAYLIASAADEIVVTQTGEVGSIGIVMTHMDVSEYAKKQGVKVTHVYAGAQKVLGTPYAPLSDADRKKLQADVDVLYEKFVATVARNRSIDPDIVRGTEAAVFFADEALKLRLADQISSGRQVLEDLIKRASPGARSPFNSINGENEMSGTNTKTPAAGDAPAQTAPQADAVTAARDAGLRKEGALAERARIKAINTSAEAEGRTELASHLAYETEMAADAAVALLAKSPKASAAAAGSPLDRAMAAAGTPGVRSEDAGPAVAETSRVDAVSIYSARRATK